MKKYLYLLIVIMLGFSMSACSKTAAATEAPADASAPVDSGDLADTGSAATEAPAPPADSGAPAPSDEMDGFLFVPMEGEYEPQVDIREFIAILREESGISGDLQLVSALPAGTTWDAVLAHYDGEAKANGWVLEKTEDVTTPKGYLSSVALFTHGNNKILLVYYPLNGEIVIIQIQGQ